jgi:hypothetical protein
VIFSDSESLDQYSYRVIVTDLAGNVTIGTPIKALRILLDAEISAGIVTARFENNTEAPITANVFLAVYTKSGVLVYVEKEPFTANAKGEFSHHFSLNAALYPPSEYIYKAFAWDDQLSPIVDGLSIE